MRFDGPAKSWVADAKEIEGREAPRSVTAPHPFGRVPLLGFELSEGLWAGGKLEGIQKQITELDNGLSWQELMSLYAMPVVKSDKKFEQMMGESYYIHLGAADSFDYAEPSGTAFAATMKHREMLKEEAFRISHQMAQSVGAEASTAGRSGESKKRDQNPTLVVLAALAERATAYAASIVDCVKRVNGSTADIQITGLDEFDLEDGADFLSDASTANMLPMPSPTAKREVAKKVVRVVLPKITPAVLAKIDSEIDGAPDEAFATFDPLGAPPDADDADGE